jgi:hypothetical protein
MSIRKPVPVPSPTTEMTFNSLRGVQYCEVWLIGGTPATGLTADYYNTSGVNDSANKAETCPPGSWAKVNAEALKTDYDIVSAYKNGPRGWTLDSIEISVGPVVTFEGVETRWWGKRELPRGIGTEQGPRLYNPLHSYRKSTMTFEKGKPVFIIDDPEGTPWVMKAWSMIAGPTPTYDSLSKLGNKLKLPGGWAFRVAMLPKDLTISTLQGHAWIIQDELGNTYDACKEGASNYKP